MIQALEEKKEKLKGMKIWAVEASRVAREKLIRRLSRFPKCQVVSSLDDIEAPGGLEGCFFSNEFFDALPFRRLRYSSAGWKEIYVSLVDGDVEFLPNAPSAEDVIPAKAGIQSLNILQKN